MSNDLAALIEGIADAYSHIQDMDAAYVQHALSTVHIPIPEVPETKLEEAYRASEMEELYDMEIGKYSVVVTMKCMEKDIVCLFDTGAQSNIMSCDAIEKFGLRDLIDTSRCAKIVGVSGEMHAIGFIPRVTMSIGDYMCPACFTVAPLDKTYDCIIGINFMRFYGICIDFGNSQVTMKGQHIPFCLK